MAKLTKRQGEVLRRMAGDVPLIGYFDVWGGHWWMIGDIPIQANTRDRLVDAGMIKPGENVGVFRGRWETRYRLTDAGRAALQSEPQDDGE